MHHNTASVNLAALLVQYLQGNSNQFGSGFFVLMRIELMFKIANKKIAWLAILKVISGLLVL